MSLFTRLFKRDETQPGEQPTAPTENQDLAPAESSQAPASAADATVQMAVSTAESAQAAEQRTPEAARPPDLPRPAPASAIDTEITPPPLRSAAKPQDAKVMSEKKPVDSPAKVPEASQARVPASGEKVEISTGKAAPRAAMPAPSAAATRATPEAKPAPRGAAAGLPKAAAVPADKRAAPKPGAEVATAKPQAASPASTAAAQPATRSPAAAATPTPATAAAANAAAVAETLAAPQQAAPSKPIELEPSPRELFDASAPHLLDALLHLMLELHGAESAPGEWARGCADSLRMLRAMGAKLGNAALQEALDRMLLLLERVEREGLIRIEGELRDEFLRAYASLRAQIPAALDPARELARRDPLLVEQILLQVNGVQLPTLSKLRASGWTSCEAFLRRTAGELVRDTGMDAALAERIIGAFAAFRRQFATLAPAPSRSEELRRLGVLLDELRAQQARFEHASARFADEDLRERRLQREARARSVHGIYALLARLGEIERIAALERVPFQAKLSELTTYLSSATRSPIFVS